MTQTGRLAGLAESRPYGSLSQVIEIDKRVAELQIGQAAKIHRSDVLKAIIDEWTERRRPTPSI